MVSETNYALRHRATGDWLVADFTTVRVVKNPSLVKRANTAKTHRLRALKLKPNLFPIDIHEIEVRSEEKDAIKEIEIVQERVRDILILLKNKKLGRYFYDRNGYIPEFIEFIQSLLEANEKNRAMRYIAVFNSNEYPRNISRDIISYSNKGNVFLLKSENDLTMVKLYEGFQPSFIYDFNEKRIIEIGGEPPDA